MITANTVSNAANNVYLPSCVYIRLDGNMSGIVKVDLTGLTQQEGIAAPDVQNVIEVYVMCVESGLTAGEEIASAADSGGTGAD